MLMLKSTLRFFLDKETIDNLIEEHKVAPHLRVLQRKLAEELTILFIRKDWKRLKP
jgi:tyrosyl-tRNA synthetase